jgi:hypothetical protein
MLSILCLTLAFSAGPLAASQVRQPPKPPFVDEDPTRTRVPGEEDDEAQKDPKKELKKETEKKEDASPKEEPRLIPVAGQEADNPDFVPVITGLEALSREDSEEIGKLIPSLGAEETYAEKVPALLKWLGARNDAVAAAAA